MSNVKTNFIKQVKVDSTDYNLPFSNNLVLNDYIRVYCDSSQGTNGVGTSSSPFNNIDDALNYANNGYNEYRIYLAAGTYNIQNVKSISNTNLHIVPYNGNITINYNHPDDGVFNFYNSHVNIGADSYRTTLNFTTSATTYFEGGNTTFRNCAFHSNHNLSFISQGLVIIQKCTIYTEITLRGSNVYWRSSHVNLSDLLENTGANECIYALCSTLYLDTMTDEQRPIFNMVNNTGIKRCFNFESSKLVMGVGGITVNYDGTTISHTGIFNYSEILGSTAHINLLINNLSIALTDSLLNGEFNHDEVIEPIT